MADKTVEAAVRNFYAAEAKVRRISDSLYSAFGSSTMRRRAVLRAKLGIACEHRDRLWKVLIEVVACTGESEDGRPCVLKHGHDEPCRWLRVSAARKSA